MNGATRRTVVQEMSGNKSFTLLAAIYMFDIYIKDDTLDGNVFNIM